MIRWCRALIALLAALVPAHRRRDWAEEWLAEMAELVRRAERVPRRYGVPGRAVIGFTLGAVPHALYECREGWTMEVLLMECRHALRSIARHRIFASTAIALIAIGVGANTTVFTIVEAVLFRPPAHVVGADRIVQLGRGNSPGEFDSWSHPRYVAFRDDQQVLTNVAAYASNDVVIGSGDDTELVSAQVVSSGYFPLLGVRISQGRAFTDDEERGADAHAVAIISDELWHRRFAASRAAVGQSLRIAGREFEVVGVAPAGFVGADIAASRPDVWLPLSMHAAAMGKTIERLGNANLSWLRVAGRLAAGVEVAQARAALSALVARLEQDRPADRRDGVVLVAGLGLRPGERDIAERILVVLLAVVGGLLLIASANLAGLLLARGAARRGEMAVRLAIGASRGRLVRQLLVETTMIAVLGSVAAFALTFWTARLVTPLIPYDVAVSYTPDLRVLAFGLMVGVGTSLVFGLAPAWRTARTDLITLVRADAPGLAVGDRGRLQRGLTVVQIALSFVLLANTGLLVRSVQRMNATDPGFRTTDVLVGALDLRSDAPADSSLPLSIDGAMQAVAAMPGVMGVARASAVPATGSMSSRTMWRVDRFDPAARPPSVRYLQIDTAYLAVMGIPLVRGRGFAVSDTATAAPVMLINESMARLYWPDGDALDGRIAYATLDGPKAARVIGIVRDVRNRSLREPPAPQAYLPIDPRARRALLHVRTATPTPAFASRLAATIRRSAPSAPAPSFETVRERLGRSLADVRLIASLGATFALLALVLAAAGLYAVVAYGAAQRRREYGIRLALGASPRLIAALVARYAGRLLGVGLALGVLGAAATGRLLRHQLFGVTPYDPATFAAMAALLAVAALIAALVPAIAAARVDPARSFRDS